MSKQTFTTGQVLTAAQLTNLQQTAMLGGNAVTKTASYVLVAADAGSTVAMTSTSATTVTVNSGLFAAGDTVFIQNRGTGNLTVTAGTATVATAGSAILPQNDAGILYFTSASASIFYDFIQVGAASPLTTKGDLYTFGTSDTRLAVGATNGMVLTVDSNEATGLKFATPAGGGLSLVAIQSTVKTDTFTTASTSFVDVTGLSVNITPTSASSQILVMFTINGSQEVASGRASLKLLRDSTVIMAGAAAGNRTPALGAFGALDQSIPSAPVSGSFLDSPSTTSGLTYKVQVGVPAGSGSAYVNRTMQDTDNANQIRMASSITVMEIL